MITASLGYANAPVGIPPIMKTIVVKSPPHSSQSSLLFFPFMNLTALQKREASIGDFFQLKGDEVVIKSNHLFTFKANY